MNYQITISDHALEEMVLAASESFVLGNASQWESTEIQGYLWGSRRADAANSVEYIQVDKFSVSVSAWGDESFVSVDDRVALLKNSVLELWAPHYHFLGTFHTHPYETLDDVKKNQGWDFSEEDREGFLEYETLWELAAPSHPIAMVMAVTRIAKIHTSLLNVENNRIEFNVGNLRFWLSVGIGGMSRGKDKMFSTDDLLFHQFTRYVNLAGSELRGIDDD